MGLLWFCSKGCRPGKATAVGAAGSTAGIAAGMLKIEPGRRETLAANRPRWELAEQEQGRGMCCSSPAPALPLCSSGPSFLPSFHWRDLKKRPRECQ